MKLYEGLIALIVAFSVVGCDSACEDANDKLDEECKDEIARAHEGQSYSGLPISGGSEECNDDERCVAVCILEADCPAIAWVMTHSGQTDPDDPPPPGTGELLSCVMECIEEWSQE
jgi:hypothetical protein